MVSLTFATLTLAASVAYAHAHDHHHHNARFAPTPITKRQDNGSIPPLSAIVPINTFPSSDTAALPTIYPANSKPLFADNAPVLPDLSVAAAVAWPSLWNVTPDINSDLVKQWMQELDGHTIPKIDANHISVNRTMLCDENPDARAKAGPDGNCWWTCGGCIRQSDISTCKDKDVWGQTFDDGPTVFTNQLLNYLDSKNIKATFFVIGGNAAAHPDTLRYEHMTGHEIGVHTWSHPPLTGLSNEQIVSELGWTRKAIQDVIGVTPILFRPPFGDIDDRVRAIAYAMGLTPVLWTSITEGNTLMEWDSNDWQVHSGDVEAVENQAAFNGILEKSKDLETGFIVLQHDASLETVEIAIGTTIPDALTHGYKHKSVQVCQNTPLGNAYQETSIANPKVPEPDFGTDSSANPNESSSGSSHTTPTTSGPSPSKTGGAGRSALLHQGVLGAYAAAVCFMFTAIML